MHATRQCRWWSYSERHALSKLCSNVSSGGQYIALLHAFNEPSKPRHLVSVRLICSTSDSVLKVSELSSSWRACMVTGTLSTAYVYVFKQTSGSVSKAQAYRHQGAMCHLPSRHAGPFSCDCYVLLMLRLVAFPPESSFFAFLPHSM